MHTHTHAHNKHAHTCAHTIHLTSSAQAAPIHLAHVPVLLPASCSIYNWMKKMCGLAHLMWGWGVRSFVPGCQNEFLSEVCPYGAFASVPFLAPVTKCLTTDLRLTGLPWLTVWGSSQWRKHWQQEREASTGRTSPAVRSSAAVSPLFSLGLQPCGSPWPQSARMQGSWGALSTALEIMSQDSCFLKQGEGGQTNKGGNAPNSHLQPRLMHVSCMCGF